MSNRERIDLFSQERSDLLVDENNFRLQNGATEYLEFDKINCLMSYTCDPTMLECVTLREHIQSMSNLFS